MMQIAGRNCFISQSRTVSAVFKIQPKVHTPPQRICNLAHAPTSKSDIGSILDAIALPKGASVDFPGNHWTFASKESCPELEKFSPNDSPDTTNNSEISPE
jgi:hypothetical protein